MSQMSLLDGRNAPALDLWYVEHLRNMSSVPGIFSAQRFTTMTPGFPSSVALYSVVSEQAFEDPFYKRIRGLGTIASLIDERRHHVNFFSGLDAAPQVGDDECLLLTDAQTPGGSIAGIPFTWLKCVARDFSTPYRGIAVAGRNALSAFDAAVAVFRPASVRYGQA